VRARAQWWWLVAGLIVAAFVARALLARYVVAPWIAPDETEHALAARSFLDTGHYLFRDHPNAIPSIYPALISPAWLASSVSTAYTAMKTINSALLAAGAIPLYLWARRVATPPWAAFAVLLYLAMPGFMYSGELMTENAYIPATLLALFAMAVAIERPSLLNQAFALGAVALAVASRLQGVVLMVVLPVAIALALVFDAVAAVPGGRGRVVKERLWRFWPTLGVLVVGFVAYVVYESARGRSLSGGFGIYQEVGQAHYDFVTVLRWVVYHWGELSFAIALLPLSALIVLLGLACRRATAPSPAERAFLAVGTPALVLTVVQAAAFASDYSLRVEERYLESVLPVLFIALAAWLSHGLPRPAGLTAAALLVPVAFLYALPFESLISTQAYATDTFGLIPLARLTMKLSGGAADARILLGVGMVGAAVLFAALPRAWARIAVPAAVLGFLLLSSGSVFAQVTFQSRASLGALGVTGDQSWIDRAVGRDSRVEFLYTPEIEADQHALYEAEFWNRSVHRVFGVTAPVPSISDVNAPLDPATGQIRPQLPAGSPDLRPRYVVASSALAVAGKRIAGTGGLALYRVRQPLRLQTLTAGLTPDAWTSPSATYTRYVESPGGARMIVGVSRPPLDGPPPATVTATIGPLRVVNGAPAIGRAWARQSWVVQNGATHQFHLPVRHGPFQVQLTASPSFVPTSYGYDDSRTLGVQAAFTFEP
jgi:hypothetical protein